MGKWYRRGRYDREHGRPYRPPHDDFITLLLLSERQRERQAYDEGWNDGA